MAASVANQVRYANHRCGRSGIVEVVVVTTYGMSKTEQETSRENARGQIDSTLTIDNRIAEPGIFAAQDDRSFGNALRATHSRLYGQRQPTEGARPMLPQGTLKGSCEMLLGGGSAYAKRSQKMPPGTLTDPRNCCGRDGKPRDRMSGNEEEVYWVGCGRCQKSGQGRDPWAEPISDTSSSERREGSRSNSKSSCLQ